MKKNLFIKQSFAFLLFVIMVLSSWIRLWEVYVYAADDSNGTSEAYYRIKVTSGASKKIRMLSLMVTDDHVYAEATELASIMGYTADKKEDTISITNRDNSEIPFLYCFFYNGKKLVRRNIVTEQGEYEAPFECRINEEGAWIPFEYSVYLLNSSMLVLGDHIYIEKPHKKAIDIIYDEMSNRNNFFHQFYNSDYHKEMKTASDASRVVNVFDGILSFDLDSWLEYIQGFSGLSTAYDSKYGKEVALLICTMSKKESPSLSDDFASTSGSINTVSDLLSESTTEIREYLEKLNKNESLAEVNWIGTLSNKNNSIASADDAYNYLMLTQNKRDLRYLLGEDAALDVYDSLSVDAKGISFDAADYIKVVGGVLEGISYMTQFQNQDSFTVEALETILEDTNWRKWNLPNASVDGMKSTVEDLKSNVVKYSAFKYIRNNLLNTAKDVINLRELIGGPASAELVLWSILKNVFPFYSEGLSTTHNFELASYAYVFQCDTLALYMKKRDEVLNKDTIQSVTSEDLWPVIQYLYTYLKDAYVTREADIGSFNSDQQEEFAPYIQELESKNRIIINSLALLKKGTKDNQYYNTYGILPSENMEFLTKLNDGLIIDFIKDYGMGIDDLSIPADFQKLMQEYVQEYGLIKRGVNSWSVDSDFYYTGGLPYERRANSEGIILGDVYDYDLDDVPELLIIRRQNSSISTFERSEYIFEMFELAEEGCERSDKIVVGVFDCLNWYVNYTSMSLFRHEMEKYVDICMETYFCGQDHPDDTALIKLYYHDNKFSVIDGIRFGYWFRENGVLCKEISAVNAVDYLSSDNELGFAYWDDIVVTDSNTDSTYIEKRNKKMNALGLNIRKTRLDIEKEYDSRNKADSDSIDYVANKTSYMSKVTATDCYTPTVGTLSQMAFMCETHEASDDEGDINLIHFLDVSLDMALYNPLEIKSDESASQTYTIIPDEVFNMKASEAAEYLGLNIQNTVGHHSLNEMFSRVKMPSHPRNSTNIMCSHGDEDKNGAWSLELYEDMFSLYGTYLGMPKAQAKKCLKQANWEISEIQYSDYFLEEGDVIRNGEQYISYVPKDKRSFAYKNSGEIDIVVNLISNSVTSIVYIGGNEEEEEEKEGIYDYVIKELQGLWYSNTMGAEGPSSKMVCEGNNFNGEIEDIVEYEEGYLVRISGGYSYYFGKSLDSCIFIDGWESTGDNSYGTSGWWKPNEEHRVQFGD